MMSTSQIHPTSGRSREIALPLRPQQKPIEAFGANFRIATFERRARSHRMARQLRKIIVVNEASREP